MKTNKGLSTILLIAFALLATLALRPVFADIGSDAAPDDAAVAEHLNDMRAIMHFAKVEATPVAQGVKVTVTGDNADLTAAIQREFTGEQHVLKSPFDGVTVSIEALENGAALVYTSDDPETADQLQALGTQLVYSELRDNMHEAMTAYRGGKGWFGGMHRFGDKGQGYGPMHGPGYGRGEDGQGRGQGYGPMHGPGYGRGGQGPGWMHGNGPAEPQGN